MVIAGKAAAGSEVDVVVDGVVVAKGKADAGGDFAIVLEKPLAPGDHQIVLVARAETGEPLQSAETATVSIPDTPGGEVLAMIEEPGKASEIVTMPKPADGSGKAGCRRCRTRRSRLRSPRLIRPSPPTP